jgi:pSer/pThr/pTyr-binding forkhead associated (FHA) protein
MPKLTVTLQDGTELSHDLIEREITIGRAPENTLQIEDASVSSSHATLTATDNGDYIFRDIGSTNGSRINGRNVEPNADHRLQDGDHVRLGKVEGTYASENPAEARPLPEEETLSLAPATSSAAPTNFQNASPFQTKKKKKDPGGMAVMALCIVSILVFLAALAKVAGLQSPLN